MTRFKTLLGNGKSLGLNLSYAVQSVPRGIAEAFIIAKDFIGDDEVALILGDNIFDGNDLLDVLSFAVRDVSVNKGAHLLGYYVEDPERFGIVDFDTDGHVLSIEEKPKNPKSNYCVTGLYFYDNKVVEYASRLKPSTRGELEITDINKMYLEDGNIYVSILDNDNYIWIDAGTFDSLAEATQYMKSKSKRAYSA